jgi:hypothetical protein
MMRGLKRYWRSLVLLASLAAMVLVVMALFVFPVKRTRETDTAVRRIPPQMINPIPAMGPVPARPPPVPVAPPR